MNSIIDCGHIAKLTLFPRWSRSIWITAWEQRKLNEYLETSREKNESCRFDKDNVLSVSGDYGIVNQIEFQGRSYAGASVANYGVVHKGDVVYTKSPLRSNPYGIIKTNRGNDGIVSTLYAVYHPAERTHPDFVEVYFEQNARMNNYMAPLVSKGAKNDMKVSAENALKGVVIFPEIEEQEVIASYFSQLDHLITLHQRKCQYRCLYGYLSWEQRKLGDVATRHDNLRIPIAAKDRIPGDTPYYGANGIQDYVEGYTHEGEFVLVAEDGATDLDNYPVQLISGLSWVNNHAHVIKAIPDVAQNRFIMHLIKSMDIASYLVGGTRSKLNAEVLMEIEIKLPSNSEQIHVGALLSTLDSLITLHQRQSNGKAHNIIILSRTKNRQLDIAKSAVLGLETRGNSRKLLNEHPIQQRFLDIP